MFKDEEVSHATQRYLTMVRLFAAVNELASIKYENEIQESRVAGLDLLPRSERGEVVSIFKN